jgi:hypothetical protein
MKCEQCGFIVDVLPEGGGEYLCPNCGYCMRKGAPSAPGEGTSALTDPSSGTATHLKIAKTVNVGFGDFASVLAATDASKIAPTDTRHGDVERTRTASASTLNVAAPEDDVLSPIDVYDEDDEYARIQADISARQQALEQRSAELDAREKHLNKKLDEIIAEKEFLRTGIEKSDREHAAYMKQKDALDAQRAAMEKELAARKASLDARAAEIERKNESLVKTRTALEDLKRELDASMTGEQSVAGTTSSVSIPYSAKLLRQNNSLIRTVRILKRILIGLAVLAVILIVFLFVKESELRRARTLLKRVPECAYPARSETVSEPSEDTLNTEHQSAPESETSAAGL